MSQVQGGALPFNGPYALRSLEALRAYQTALAQVNQGRNQFLQGAGYTMGPHGALQVNGGDPYSAYAQMQTGIGDDTQHFEQNFNQGWGDLAAANQDQGVGGYQHEQFQQHEGGIRSAFGQKLLSNLANFTQAQQAARTQYNQSRLGNRNQLIDYLTSHQQFSAPKAVK